MNQLLVSFKQYLVTLQLGAVSRKLYAADLARFLRYLGEAPTLDQLSSPKVYSAYLSHLHAQATDPTMLRRTQAALRQFGNFIASSYNLPNPYPSVQLGVVSPESLLQKYIKLFTDYLNTLHLSPSTIKSYKSDVNLFLTYTQSHTTSNNMSQVLSKKNIEKYLNYLTDSHTTLPRTIERKVQSLSRFHAWYTQVYAPSHPSDNNTSPSQALPHPQESTRESHSPSVSPSQPDQSKNLVKNTNYRRRLLALLPNLGSATVRNFATLLILLVFTSTLAIFGYRQFSRDVVLTQAYPSTPVTPNRQLSFQGRLENAGGTPITTATNMVFKLFTASSGGSELYSSGTCSIDPDADGVFNTQIGDTCGSAIAATVFTENQDVWLEVTVGAETLDPRQQIATVAYALNAETIQGFPISSTVSAIRNTVVPMNQWGEIIVGEQSPRLTGVSGTFQISAPSLSFVTATGTNGNITLAPDGTGQINFNGNTTSTNFFNVSDAQLTTGSLITGTAANNNTGFKLLDLLSGSSPTSKFSVTDAGNVTLAGDLTITGGNVTSATTFDSTLTSTGVLTANNTFDANGIVTLGDGGDAITIDGSSLGLQTTGAGSDITINAVDQINLPDFTNGGSGCSALETDASGNLACGVDDGSGVTQYWRLNLGTISPVNDTLDLLVGSNATASAKAGFLNMNSGTPTATVSAGTAGGAFLTATGALSTTARQSLVLGNSATYNTTGNVLINPNGTGNVGIGTTAPASTLDVSGVIRSTSYMTPASGVGIEVSYNTVDQIGRILAYDRGGSAYKDLGLGINSGTQLKLLSTGVTSFTAGNIGFGTTAPDARVEINHATGDNLRLTYNDADGSATAYTDFSLASDGDLTIDSAGGAISLGSGDDLNLTAAGDLIFAGTTSLAETTAANDSGAYMVGTFDEFDNSNSLNVQDVLDDLDAGLTTALGSTSPWTEGAGILYPKNSTVDLLVGGQATSSAKFAVLNMNSGTPTASISGTTANVATYLTGEGNLATTNMAPLTIGGASTGPISLKPKNTTGLNIDGTGKVGIGTANPTVTLDVNGSIKIPDWSTSSLTIGSTVLSESGGILGIDTGANVWYIREGVGIHNAAVTGAPLLSYSASTSTNPGFSFNDDTNTGVGHTSADVLALVAGGTNVGNVTTTGVGVFTTAPDAALEINHATGDNLRLTYNDSNGSATAYTDFSLASDGDLTIDSAGGAITLGSGDDLNLTAAGDLIFAGTTSLAETTAANDSGAYLVGTFDEFDNSASANVQDVLDDLDAAITSAASTGYWRLNLGTISPTNDTLDLLVGANSTASAKFKVININSGTPTASISGTTSNVATFLTGEGALSTTNRQPLVLGNSASFNSTGPILLQPNGTGNVGIGTTVPASKLDVFDDDVRVSSSFTANDALGNGLEFYNRLSSNGSAQVVASIVPSRNYNTHNGGTIWFNVSSSGEAPSVRMMINGDGKVGIGSTATSQLSGKSLLNVVGATGEGIRLISLSGSGNNWLFTNGISGLSHDYFQFINASSSQIVWTSKDTGQMGINTKSADARLEINDSTGDVLRLTYNDDNGSATAYTDFSLASDGDLTIDSAGGAITLGSGDDLNLTAAGDLVIGTTTLAETTAANDSGAYLVGTFDEFDNSASLNVQDVLDDLDAAISGAALSSAIPWVEGSGILYPKNSTVDLLVGGQATSSAKFKVININSGTPTASISGTTANVATFLTGEGNLATTNMAPLTIGGVSTGPISLKPKNTTGLNIDGVGNVGVGVASPSYPLDVVGDGVQAARFGNTGGGNTTYINIAGSTYGLWMGFDYNGGNIINRVSSRSGISFDVSNTGTFGGGTTAALYLKASTGVAGFNTTSPDARLEINDAAGDNLRLTYNDSNGSATAYTDFSLASDGDLTIDSAGGAINFSDIINFAGGTTYYVDASGNAKFLDLQVADTGNPGLTVGDGTTGFIKVGGSTISDNAGNLTFDSDSAAITFAADDTTLTATGLATLDTAATVAWDVATLNATSLATLDTAAAVAWDATTLTLGSNSTLNGGSSANDDLTLQGTSNSTRATSYLNLQPNGGFVTIGVTGPSSPFGTLDLRSTLGTVPVASISGATSMASLLVDQSGTGDLFTASSSGATKFKIDKSGNVHIYGNLTCDGDCSDIKLETFVNGGTYTKPNDATMILVEGYGSGGGGGGGSQGTTAQYRGGGGGGGGGAYVTDTFPAASISATVTVTVPAGGAGGGSLTDGTAGSSSSFGSYLTAYGGGGGGNNGATGGGGSGGGGGGRTSVGGSSVDDVNGAGGGPNGGALATDAIYSDGGAAGGDATTGTNGSTGGSAYVGGGGGGAATTTGQNQSGHGGSSLHGAGGGGGGATATAITCALRDGGNGGVSNNYANLGVGGAAGGTGAGGAGTDGSALAGYGGGGGGGGANICASGTGGNGGNGGAPGGGGGGGGAAAAASGTTGGTGGNGARGEIRVWSISSNAADLAEIYTSHDTTLEAGDVVAVDPTLRAGVKKSTLGYESAVLGVVSTRPNLVIGDATNEGSNVVPVALAGRVPVKVSLENGPIVSGDKLTSSSTPGVAMKATKAGMTLGTAIGSYHGEASESDRVMMFVNTSYTQGMLVHQLLSQHGYDIPEDVWRSNSLDYSWIVLATMVSEGQQLTHQQISDIYGDRVAATLEVIAPRVIAKDVYTATIHGDEQGNLVIDALRTFVNNIFQARSLQTNLLSPLDPDVPLIITQHPDNPPTQYPSGQTYPPEDLPTLVVDGTLDVATLSARTARLDSLEVNQLVANRISANSIEGLEATIATLSAHTTSSLSESDLSSITERIKDRLQLLTATPSGTAADLPLPPEATSSSFIPTTDYQLPDTASDSATLTSLDTNFATINNYLAVIGSATITSLHVTSDLFTETLQSQTGQLALQPFGGTVRLAQNTLIVDSTGSVSVNGSLNVSGNLALRPSPTTSLGKLLQVYNEAGVEVASIDASGSATLADLTTKLVTIASQGDTATPSALSSSTTSNATAGEATLVSPNTELTITSPYITSNSLVYLTPTGFTDNKVLFVKAKNSCPTPETCTSSFTVGIDAPASADIPFNWWIIQLQ